MYLVLCAALLALYALKRLYVITRAQLVGCLLYFWTSMLMFLDGISPRNVTNVCQNSGQLFNPPLSLARCYPGLLFTVGSVSSGTIEALVRKLLTLGVLLILNLMDQLGSVQGCKFEDSRCRAGLVWSEYDLYSQSAGLASMPRIELPV